MNSLAEDRDAIRDIATRYAHYLDMNRIDDFIGLFAEDGEFVGSTTTLKGHVALQKFIESRIEAGIDQEKHLMANILIDVDGNSATMSSYFFRCVGDPPQLVGAGMFNDLLTRIDGRWLIERRVLVTS